MDSQNSGSTSAAMRLDVGLEFHKTIDFDKRALRAAIKKGGTLVAKSARRLVSRRAISLAGEYPGKDTGRLRRSIGTIRVGSRGGWVRVGPRTFKDGHFFYPAVLFYGSQKMNIAKRGNFMTAALAEQAPQVRNDIRTVMRNSLVPR